MAEQNLIKKDDLARAREVDFTYRFNDSIRKLVQALGITRKIPKQAGTVLKAYKAVGTLENGVIAEGETIPLSKYETVPVTFKEITLKKYRKGTSAEAIIDGGYDQAVNMTTNKMLKDVQKVIKNEFFGFLDEGTGKANGATFQAALAQSWGQLQVKYEDTEFSAVHFLNPLDVADYLATANITLQTAFGMTYVEDFLGLGTAFFNSAVPQGKIYSTAKENIIMYYIPVNGADLGEAFNFTSDELGLIGIHEVPDYTNMTAFDTVVNGLTLFAERLDGIIVATIGSAAPTATKVAPLTGTAYGVAVSDMQDGVAVGKDAITGENIITGTLKWLSGDNAIVNEWGEGNFLCLDFSDYPDLSVAGNSVLVGLEPSYGTGLLPIATDDHFLTAKINDKKAQVVKVVTTVGGKSTTEVFRINNLVLESDEA